MWIMRTSLLYAHTVSGARYPDGLKIEGTSASRITGVQATDNPNNSMVSRYDVRLVRY